MTNDGPPPRHTTHLRPVTDEPPYDPDYDRQANTQRGASNDPAAERALIAAALDHNTPADLADLVKPTDFFTPWHETIWTTWLQLIASANGTRPDAVLLNSTLLKHGEASAVRTLADIVTKPAPAGLADYYARIVRDHARLRGIDQIATKLRQYAAAGNPDNVETVMADALQDLETAVTHWGPGTSTRTPHTWTPIDIGSVLDDPDHEFDPPPAILARTDGHHLLYAGAVHTFSGEPASGKTWATLLAAHQQLAAGQIVTMVDFEDRASRVVSRLLGLGANPTHVRNQFRYIRPHSALDATSRPDLQAAVTGASLVILDGVTEAMTLHGLELEKNADIARFYDTLPRWIADHSGAAVAMVDHVVKDTEKQGRWALGGQHKLAGIDGVAYLVKAIEPFGRGKTGIARISVSKDRPGYVEEIAVGRVVAELHLDARDVNCLRGDLRPPSITPVDQAGNMRPTHLMERISRWLELTPGANKSTIIDGVTGKATYKRRALDRLIQEGYVEANIGTNREQTHRVIQPFREHEEETLG